MEELGKIKTPSRSSYFGIVDLCGFPKDRYYNYKSYWRPDVPTVHILASIGTLARRIRGNNSRSMFILREMLLNCF
ncbi:MAG: hypothetical protein ACLVL2_08220 [Bacteroides cellulosilyticus]